MTDSNEDNNEDNSMAPKTINDEEAEGGAVLQEIDGLDIRGIIESSMLDWDGQLVTVLFVPACNFRCPFCQNSALLTEPDKFEKVELSRIKALLDEHHDFLDGICMTGGEPTLYKGLPEFFKAIKEWGFKAKLDTNGTNPEMLSRLIAEGLVDYIAMDLKAPLDKRYITASGRENVNLEDIQKSIEIIMASNLPYEFRTTIIPVWYDTETMQEMAKLIKGADKYFLQQFVPDDALDEEFRSIKPGTKEYMEELLEAAKEYVPNAKLRGMR